MSFLRILESTIYQQIDDTGAKVKGQNHYVQIICNPFYTAYFTIPHKDRLFLIKNWMKSRCISLWKRYFLIPVKALLSDAAPQFKKLTEEQALCWIHDGKLLQFKQDLSQENAEKLSETKDIKSELLLTLKYPEIPLHNNAAELGARSQVRKRDVSLHTMTEEGTKANDTFSTIVQTAKKLGVSAYEYFNDRVSKSFKMPSLAELIGAKKYSTFSCKDNG